MKKSTCRFSPLKKLPSTPIKSIVCLKKRNVCPEQKHICHVHLARLQRINVLLVDGAVEGGTAEVAPLLLQDLLVQVGRALVDNHLEDLDHLAIPHHYMVLGSGQTFELNVHLLLLDQVLLEEGQVNDGRTQLDRSQAVPEVGAHLLLAQNERVTLQVGAQQIQVRPELELLDGRRLQQLGVQQLPTRLGLLELHFVRRVFPHGYVALVGACRDYALGCRVADRQDRLGVRIPFILDIDRLIIMVCYLFLFRF